MKLRALTLVLLASASPRLRGCTAFATVRSAEVRPGASLAVHASASTPPGDVAGWFWSYDCAQDCNHPVVGGDVGLTYGWRGPRAVALGAGLSGEYPYVDGYLQLGAGRQPFGVGVRVGPPVTSWREHQLYGRYDVRLGATSRLLVNPGLFLHEGRAPNGENPGTFFGFVQCLGVLIPGDRVSWTPAVALIAGRARRSSYGQRYGPAHPVLATASLGITWHRRRAPDQ